MDLKQIGMASGTLKSNRTLYGVDLINKNPVTLNMAVERAFPLAVKRVVIAFWRQGLFINDHFHRFEEFINIHAAFFHQLVLLFESLRVNWLKHGLIVRVIPFKVFKHLFKRMEASGGNLPIGNSYAFLNGGDSLGIVARISCYGVDVRGADGTRVRMGVFIGSGFFSRSKGKNSPPCGYFAGYVNSQPVVGRYFYSLRDAHKETIA